MKRALLLWILSLFVVPVWAFEEALPIAPKRSDDRDRLPTAPFVSLTGQDPFLPEQEGQQRSVAGKESSSSSDKMGKKKSGAKTKPTGSKTARPTKNSKSVNARKSEDRASQSRAPAQKKPSKPQNNSKSNSKGKTPRK